MKQPAIFLDRDGVINENVANYVRSWAQMDIFPQAVTAIARISHTPYKLFIVTNQSAIGRGIISLETAQEINQKLVTIITKAGGRIDQAYLCPHAPDDQCHCRKPQPGMLLRAAQEHNIDLTQSIMIGDALTDIQAGQNAGVKTTALLLTGRGKVQSKRPLASQLPPFHTYPDLTHALQTLIP